MRVLSASELLQVWEKGLNQSFLQRALILLASACPERSLEELAQLSIGQRDLLLLTLRELMFGSQLLGVVSCPSCSDHLELNFKVADIQVETKLPPDAELSLDLADYQVQFRLPNSIDLAATTAQITILEAPLAAQQLLLERCLLAVSLQGKTQTIEQLPAHVLEAIAEQMALADPQADILLSLTCPTCSHRWKSVFDIVSYFWSEINTWAVRLLREVHILASAYGWREADILAMTPYRRQLYLEMVGR
jgi:uncharacterized protein (UPF0212 family)